MRFCGLRRMPFKFSPLRALCSARFCRGVAIGTVFLFSIFFLNRLLDSGIITRLRVFEGRLSLGGVLKSIRTFRWVQRPLGLNPSLLSILRWLVGSNRPKLFVEMKVDLEVAIVIQVLRAECRSHCLEAWCISTYRTNENFRGLSRLKLDTILLRNGLTKTSRGR